MPASGAACRPSTASPDHFALRLQDQLHWTRTRVLVVDAIVSGVFASLPLVLHAQAPLPTVIVAVASVSFAVLLWASCWTLARSVTPWRVALVVTNLGIGGPQGWAIRCAAEADASSFEMHLIAGTRDGISRVYEGEASALLADRLHLVPELGRAVAPLSDALALVALLRLYRTWRFDIVHTNMTKAGVLGRVAAVLAGTPVVIHTEHGLSFHYDHRRAVRALYDGIERVGSRWSDLVLLVSEHDVRVAATEMGFSRERIAMAKLGVALPIADASRAASTRLRLGVSEGAPLYGILTRLVRSKRVDDLIRASAIVRHSHPDAVLRDRWRWS